MELFSNVYVLYTLKIILSTVIGGFIGFERGRRGKSAGMKTHAMVCLGACLVTCVGVLMGQDSAADTTRIAAQVVSGIGFLGAGVILVTADSRIKGLTTAAGIWLAACIGIVIGSEYMWMAVPAVVCFFVITNVFQRVERLPKQESRMPGRDDDADVES